jgi:serine protease AprX
MVTRGPNPFRVKVFHTLAILLIWTNSTISGQEATFNYFYRISFTDKGSNEPGNFNLSGLFASRAVERRNKAGKPAPDFRDLPVNSTYLDRLSSMGLSLHCTSRWMNTALFKTTFPADVESLAGLPFVSEVRIVKNPGGKNVPYDKLSFTVEENGIPPYNQPLSMVNGIIVQNSGFDGKGVLVAVLDAGYLNADNITSLEDLRARKGIKDTYDFVKNAGNVYDFHSHGTAVLSILSGVLPGSVAGTAPGADYLLLRTEDPDSEYPVEEDFWIAAAEFADSTGADIITSSLGYFMFDDPLLNYKYSDLDGNTTFISRAADIAASRGILVVCSAGNERGKSWNRIIAPSDGDSVLAVGAVDGDRSIASFSSPGPSFDRRIKPDVAAQGVSVPVQTQVSAVVRSNGTSFSCPVISGMCACVMQAVPEAAGYDIIAAIHSVSDRYNSPDSLYGYGIPDMAALIAGLQEKLVVKPVNESVVSPNPFRDELTVTFRRPPGMIIAEIFNSSGMLLVKKEYRDFIGRSFRVNELEGLNPGLYFLRIRNGEEKFIHKILKPAR